MGCCDKRRRAAVSAATTPPAPSTSARHRDPPARSRLQYVGHRRIEVRGAATGTVYRFDPRNPVQLVEPRDVAGLLRTKLFRRA
jgi:hypothetical protein